MHQCAETGDDVAQAIQRRAAIELAASAQTALLRSGWTPGTPARASWTGQVLGDNDAIRTDYIAELGRRASGVEIGEPYGSSLDGVEMLLDLPSDHPLTAHFDAVSCG